jgi:phosphoglycerate dehydrogenase-like enzyme
MDAPRALLLENVAALDGVHLLGIRVEDAGDRRGHRPRPRLSAIGAFSIGTNQIDLAAAPMAVSPSSTCPSPTPAVLPETVRSTSLPGSVGERVAPRSERA